MSNGLLLLSAGLLVGVSVAHDDVDVIQMDLITNGERRGRGTRTCLAGNFTIQWFGHSMTLSHGDIDEGGFEGRGCSDAHVPGFVFSDNHGNSDDCFGYQVECTGGEAKKRCINCRGWCAANYHVSRNWCVHCPTGKFNAGYEDPSGADTSCQAPTPAPAPTALVIGQDDCAMAGCEELTKSECKVYAEDQRKGFGESGQTGVKCFYDTRGYLGTVRWWDSGMVEKYGGKCSMTYQCVCKNCAANDPAPTASTTFSPPTDSPTEACGWQCYLNRYPDLQGAFGAGNTAAAKRHYENHGKSKGRDCTCPPCADTVTGCSVHMANGGCKDAHRNHDTWRTRCVNTCGYCNDARYNPALQAR